MRLVRTFLLVSVLAVASISAVPVTPRQSEQTRSYFRAERNASEFSESTLEAYYIDGRWVDSKEFNSIAQARLRANSTNNSLGNAALGGPAPGPAPGGNACVGYEGGVIWSVEDCKFRSFCYVYCNAWGPVQTFTDWDTKLSAVVFNGGGGVSVAIEKGSSVSDSVSVSGGLKIPLVFEATLGVTYTHTWTHEGSETLVGAHTPHRTHGSTRTRAHTHPHNHTLAGFPALLAPPAHCVFFSRAPLKPCAPSYPQVVVCTVSTL